MPLNELLIQCDMLYDNINRLMVTKSIEELDSSVIHAFQKLSSIYSKRLKELKFMEVNNE